MTRLLLLGSGTRSGDEDLPHGSESQTRLALHEVLAADKETGTPSTPRHPEVTRPRAVLGGIMEQTSRTCEPEACLIAEAEGAMYRCENKCAYSNAELLSALREVMADIDSMPNRVLQASTRAQAIAAIANARWE